MFKRLEDVSFGFYDYAEQKQESKAQKHFPSRTGFIYRPPVMFRAQFYANLEQLTIIGGKGSVFSKLYDNYAVVRDLS
ncbi:hypothetical protein CVT25_001896 [Psilocybe cyanescens]|uniref:Uncharacterized protein n=1 Tax=Psilocybe cyanescens TaxID=93625 RepID=A0A409WQX6_PSICY|nr:hypothetical protein CVT25_001896 [Psilocybe cyanescens]